MRIVHGLQSLHTMGVATGIIIPWIMRTETWVHDTHGKIQDLSLSEFQLQLFQQFIFILGPNTVDLGGYSVIGIGNSPRL